jgi:hypothetical protein
MMRHLDKNNFAFHRQFTPWGRIRLEKLMFTQWNNEVFFTETKRALQNSSDIATGPYLQLSSPQLRSLLAYFNIKFYIIFPSACVARKGTFPYRFRPFFQHISLSTNIWSNTLHTDYDFFRQIFHLLSPNWALGEGRHMFVHQALNALIRGDLKKFSCS